MLLCLVCPCVLFSLADTVAVHLQGFWTVHVRTAQDTYTKGFTVEEYVLPTFEVKVEAPDTIENNEKTITTKICAE